MKSLTTHREIKELLWNEYSDVIPFTKASYLKTGLTESEKKRFYFLKSKYRNNKQRRTFVIF